MVYSVFNTMSADGGGATVKTSFCPVRHPGWSNPCLTARHVGAYETGDAPCGVGTELSERV